jgi:hypothetical protein
MLYALFWAITWRLNSIYQRFGTLCSILIGRSVYEIGTKGSETSAYKIMTPGNYPEESIQHSEQGESLKSRTCNKLIYPSLFIELSHSSWFKNTSGNTVSLCNKNYL